MATKTGVKNFSSNSFKITKRPSNSISEVINPRSTDTSLFKVKINKPREKDSSRATPMRAIHPKGTFKTEKKKGNYDVSDVFLGNV